MRKTVIDTELQSLKTLCIEEYGIDGSEQGMKKMPHITLVFVNKRIRQKFFERSGHHINNPP
jgi:hypothetical protein